MSLSYSVKSEQCQFGTGKIITVSVDIRNGEQLVADYDLSFVCHPSTNSVPLHPSSPLNFAARFEELREHWENRTAHKIEFSNEPKMGMLVNFTGHVFEMELTGNGTAVPNVSPGKVLRIMGDQPGGHELVSELLARLHEETSA